MTRFFVFPCLVGLAVASFWARQAPAQLATQRIQFGKDILPILSSNCLTCHGPDDKARKAGLRLDLAETALRTLKSGARAVVPGDVKNSELLARIFAPGDDRMPPPKSNHTLKESEKQLLKRWIAEGAEYQRHWAFVAPKRPPVPTPPSPPLTKGGTKEAPPLGKGGIKGGWAHSDVDRFILGRLEKEGLQPAPEADRYTLARRVAIDLTGLPPSLEMVDRFVADPSPDAYEKFVDQILGQPSYGERWAAVWLDLARYADSNGYAEDQPRTIWKYRDWVIHAINKNVPFDQFTIEQLAGDLVPKPTQGQLIATGFHRNTLTNTEGGTSDEEFRNFAVVDRVNTTFQVWMGLSMACAQCHTHKYDPLTQEEYFQAFAIFNQTQDNDQGDNSPNHMVMSAEEAKRKATLESDLAELNNQLAKRRPKLAADQEEWEKSVVRDKLPKNVQAILNVAAAKRNPQQKIELALHFRATLTDVQDLHQKLITSKMNLDQIKPVPTPIMKELPDKQKRVTKIHIRGDWLNQGKEVKPGVPAAFHELPKDLPPNRLALAKWLVDPRNPLTSRVAVNRYWEQIFGVGLLTTPEDFGLRSQAPTHPELLDWLAVEFQETLQWDTKKLLKLLVTSAAYRQSSKVTPALQERDPDNRLFARGPRFRSSAETVRDQALLVSGLLSKKMYGPSVRPPQPKFGLTAAFGPGTDWADSTGEDKYRRGLYTNWRRTTPYPSMLTFDAPSRTVCAVNRPRTNTPLQALVTLNDPCYVEAAQALARRMVKEGGTSTHSRVTFGFRQTLIRPPTEAETTRLATLFEIAKTQFAKNAKEAQYMATDPLGPLPPGMDAVELAAWTVLGNVLLNLDETFAKR